MRLPLHLIVLFAALSVLVFIVSLSVGSISMSPLQLWEAFHHMGDPLYQNIIWDLRFPRAASAFIVGGLLALAGTLMQVLLRNPLADPYILGVSGGAAVGALTSISLGLGGYWVSQNAFLGALISMLVVFSLSHGRGDWSPMKLLLTGVVVAAGWGAIISFTLATSQENQDNQVYSMLFWIMGDLSNSRVSISSVVILILGLCISTSFARSLNLLARGELQAAILGVNVQALRLCLYILASLLAATAVTLAGSVGFVGLIIPHIVRLLGASDHRVLLPGATLLGGGLLMFADMLARTSIAPQQLPVGVVTAAIGVPIFLIILNRGARPS